MKYIKSKFSYNTHSVPPQFGLKDGLNRDIIIWKATRWTNAYGLYGRGSKPCRRYETDTLQGFYRMCAESYYIKQILNFVFLNEDSEPQEVALPM